MKGEEDPNKDRQPLTVTHDEVKEQTNQCIHDNCKVSIDETAFKMIISHCSAYVTSFMMSLDTAEFVSDR